MKQNWKLFSLFTAFSLVLLIYPPSIHAQSKYMTRNGLIRFEAEGPIKDDIKAINNQGGCVLDAATGDILFKIPIKSFVFRRLSCRSISMKTIWNHTNFQLLN